MEPNYVKIIEMLVLQHFFQDSNKVIEENCNLSVFHGKTPLSMRLGGHDNFTGGCICSHSSGKL